jgi:hypothetical protein
MRKNERMKSFSKLLLLSAMWSFICAAFYQIAYGIGGFQIGIAGMILLGCFWINEKYPGGLWQLLKDSFESMDSNEFS